MNDINKQSLSGDFQFNQFLKYAHNLFRGETHKIEIIIRNVRIRKSKLYILQWNAHFFFVDSFASI